MDVSVEVECPRCHNVDRWEIEDLEGHSQNGDCPSCGLSLEITYTVDIVVDDVEVAHPPTLAVECPECGGTLSVDISEESGSEEIACDNCGARLEVQWSDWGADVQVEVVERPEEDEEQDGDRDAYRDEDERDEEDEEDEGDEW